MKERITEYFSEIADNRCPCDIEHKLVDVLILVMCAILCGIDELERIVAYGKEKSEFLNKHFGIVKIPSKATLSRIMNMVNADIVAEKIVQIMIDLIGTNGDIVAIDGKTICSTAKKNPWREKIHLITAYLTNNGVTLGQLSVNEKTNEIPVLRDLLKNINISGKIVTADAMHCQIETAEAIINAKGDYVIGLKKNQETFFNEVSTYIEDCIADKTIEMEKAQTIEKNRDRVEQRTCFVAPTLDWFEDKGKWKGLESAFAINRKVTTKDGISEEMSFYVSSKAESPEKFLEIVRSHWKIESMHWQLDLVFSEDDCRILSPHGQKSMSIFRKMALCLHKSYINNISTKTKPSIASNMFKSLLSNDYLLKVLSSATSVT